MTDLSHSMILINGEFKTRQIEFIKLMDNGAFCVRFKNNPKNYFFQASRVVWMTNPKWIQADKCRVYRDGVLQRNVTEIWQFNRLLTYYWRIRYNNGYESEYTSDQIRIQTSCLVEKISQDAFSYLKNVAFINPLKAEDNEDGILYDMYQKVDFIDSESAAACYLNPGKKQIDRLNRNSLIFPFGSNASQKEAVREAFENQISVIQGPPGTGKTQTILNIIANAVKNRKTVLVVSNNNSAIVNVRKKLEKYGLGFIVAPLGSRENKEAFIKSQTGIPDNIQEWALNAEDYYKTELGINASIEALDRVYLLLNELAKLQQEKQAVELEWKHFTQDNGLEENPAEWEKASSSAIIELWLKYQTLPDKTQSYGLFATLRSWWLKLLSRLRLGFTIKEEEDRNSYILKLQRLYYLNRRSEIAIKIETAEKELSLYDAKSLSNSLTEKSLSIFKASLHDRFKVHKRPLFSDVKEIRTYSEQFTHRYPVVLSTTFSARSCIFNDRLYDYIIMDEASQVSIDTGALALTCAKNAVIVGDNQQLPNVITDDDKLKLASIMERFCIPDAYDCAKNSFLKSVCSVITNAPQTLLREHYRCHPRIINFCNQKFYGGELIIMTQDNGEKDVLCAYKTVKGNHATGHLNQREIDVINKEVLPELKGHSDIGIVTPYNRQVNECKVQLPDIETATIHKYQGREKDVIIMSTVDNEITEFTDDPNMLNVAVSRAKEKFCLVLTGNEQSRHGNIMDLLDYINYNNCTITESKIASIFDYLYEQYSEQRIAMIRKNRQISEYASENLTYIMLSRLLSSDDSFSCLKLLCHFPVRQIIRDTSLLSPEESRYAGHFRTHVDFLIINRVTKKPVIAVETDGYSYHNEDTAQHHRDLMKDHIFELYGIPLIRLSTKGSGEDMKVKEILEKSMRN